MVTVALREGEGVIVALREGRDRYSSTEGGEGWL